MMKSITYIALLGFILFTSCQKVDKIEKPKHLLSKSEMKNLVYDMLLLDAASGVNENKLKELNVDMLEFLSKKYDIDSSDLEQNIMYYNLQYNESIEIYEYAKDSIERLKNAYDSISKAVDSIKKLELQKLDSIKEKDSISESQQILKSKN